MTRLDFRGAAAKCTSSGSLADDTLAITLVGDVSGWPTGASGRPFAVTLDRGVAGKMEKILCSDLAGAALTVIARGYDGTTALAHDANCSVEHGLTAGVLDDLSEHVYSTTRDDHTQYVRVDGTRGFSDIDDLVDDPVNVGTANAEGASSKFSRADHVHDIADNAVGNAQLADDCVTNAEIATDAVNNDSLATGAVHTDNIVDGAVTLAKMGGGLALVAYSGTTDANGLLAVSYSGLPFTVSNVVFGPTGDGRAAAPCVPMLFSLGNPLTISFANTKGGSAAAKAVSGTILVLGS